jgi:hypothetical protein
MTPVLAWCQRCGGGFPLFAIVQRGTGACPHCRQPLASDATAALVEWAAVVDAAYGRLVTAVQQLERLPGHLRVNTDQLLRSLAEETASPSSQALVGAHDQEGSRPEQFPGRDPFPALAAEDQEARVAVNTSGA